MWTYWLFIHERKATGDSKIRLEVGDVSYTHARKRKVPGCDFSLHLYEKELAEQLSATEIRLVIIHISIQLILSISKIFGKLLAESDVL
jgi:hypothetical protein